MRRKYVSPSGATVLALALVPLLAMTGAAAKAEPATHRCPPTTPKWARPLSGVRPYAVERDYGTSRGLACDLTVYTTNRAALEGRTSFRPGDTTATVCVVRLVGRRH